MDIIRDIFLGMVQGITGFLPVSSTGHFLLLSRLFGMDDGYTTFFLCLLKISSLIGVVVVLFKDIVKIIIGAYQLIQDLFANIVIFFRNLIFKRGEGYYVLDTNLYKRVVIMMLISSLSTYFTAVFIKNIADNSGEIPMMIGICFVISAIILVISESVAGGKRTLKNIGFFDGLIIGVVQGLTVIPGLSRVAMTYAVALLLGFGRSTAIKYSCYLAIPSIVGSALYNIHALAGTSIDLENFANIIGAMIVCGILSTFVLRYILNMVKKSIMPMFAMYGGIVGVLVILINLIV